MPYRSIAFLISLAFFVGSVTSCGDVPIANENSAPTPDANRSPEPEILAKDSSEELGLLITLPYEPAEVAWRDTETGPGGNAAPSKTLRAAVLFGPENANLLEDELKTIDPGS